MEDLKLPTTNTQEVLYALIKRGSVSLFDFPTLSGYRTRISEINRKMGRTLTKTKAERNNKFGNKYTYVTHYLPKEEKEKAIELYQKLTKR